MYIVRNSSKEVVAICSRIEDAMAYKKSEAADKTQYSIEHKKVVDKH